MPERDMCLSVQGERLGDGCRMHLHGKATMSCLPDCFQIDVYNLDSTDAAVLRNASALSVASQKTVLCEGEIVDVYTFRKDGNEITTIYLSDCEDFFQSTVNMNISKGASLTDSIRAVVARCTSPVPILYCPVEASRLPRGQAYFGRTVGVVNSLARSFGARPFLHRGGLYLVRLGEKTTETVLESEDLLDAPIIFDGGAILRTEMLGAIVGQHVSLYTDGLQGVYRVICQSFDADSYSGPWKAELLVVDESSMRMQESVLWEAML